MRLFSSFFAVCLLFSLLSAGSAFPAKAVLAPPDLKNQPSARPASVLKTSGKQTFSAPMKGTAPQKAVAVLAADSTLKEIEQLQWQWPEVSTASLSAATVHFISWPDVLHHVQEHSPEVLVALEKVIETTERKHGVQNKRILFFFKYFNSSYLEGSAQSDVDATIVHAEFVRQQALYEAFQIYVHWLETFLNHYALFGKVQHQRTVYQSASQRFWSGEVEAFDVLQARHELVTEYKNLLEAKNSSQQLTRQLQAIMGQSTATLPVEIENPFVPAPPLALFPVELTFSLHPLTHQKVNPVVSFAISMEGTPQSLEAAILEALRSRQDLAEAIYRTTSMENLFKAAQFELDKSQVRVFESNFKQFKIRESALREQIRLAVVQAMEANALAEKKGLLAEEQLKLASENLEKTRVSFKAGFSSQNELTSAENFHQQLLVQKQLARLQQCLAQARLLHEMGLFPRVLTPSSTDKPTL